MIYLLYALFFISCIVLVGTILLQPGKTDAGALFTSNISSTAFGPRGTQSVLSRITIGAAAMFMLTALLLSLPALTGNVSVLQTVGETPVQTTNPTVDPNTNSAIVNTNIATDNNSGAPTGTENANANH